MSNLLCNSIYGLLVRNRKKLLRQRSRQLEVWSSVSARGNCSRRWCRCSLNGSYLLSLCCRCRS